MFSCVIAHAEVIRMVKTVKWKTFCRCILISCPTKQRNNVISNLINDIEKKGHLTTGMIGTKYLMETFVKSIDLMWAIKLL